MRRLRCTSTARATSVSPAATAAWKVMCASIPAATGPCEFDASPNAESARAKIAPPWQPPLKLRCRASTVIATSARPGPPARKLMPSVVHRPSFATRPAIRCAPAVGIAALPARPAGVGLRCDCRAARRPTPAAARCASSAPSSSSMPLRAKALTTTTRGVQSSLAPARGAASASRASRAPSARPAAGRPCSPRGGRRSRGCRP